MFKKMLVITLSAAIFIWAAGCSLGTKENKDIYTATVEAESFYIPSEVSGKVVELSIEQGTVIKAGDSIAKIDTSIYELQKQQAAANLKLAKLKLEDIPEGAKDNVKEQARAVIEQAQAALDIAQAQIDKAAVASLNEGIVSEVLVHKGEMATAGMNIAKVINLKNKYIKVYVEEEKRNLISLYDSIPVYFNGIKFDDGKVVYISPESEFTPKNVEKKSDREKTVFEVKLKLSEKADLKPGTLVDVEVR
jgi:HlyD family secretion protein